MSARVQLDFQKMIDVNTPIIYIHAYDFVRVDDIISMVVGGSRIMEWNPITGLTNFSRSEERRVGKEV